MAVEYRTSPIGQVSRGYATHRSPRTAEGISPLFPVPDVIGDPPRCPLRAPYVSAAGGPHPNPLPQGEGTRKGAGAHAHEPPFPSFRRTAEGISPRFPVPDVIGDPPHCPLRAPYVSAAGGPHPNPLPQGEGTRKGAGAHAHEPPFPSFRRTAEGISPLFPVPDSIGDPPPLSPPSAVRERSRRPSP